MMYNQTNTIDFPQSNIIEEEVHYLRPPRSYSKVLLYDIKSFSDLLLFFVPDTIQSNLKARGMKVQNMYDARGDFNLDYYSLRINKLPNFATDPLKLLTYLRANINSFVDKDIAQFYPYSSSDGAKWNSQSFAGAVMNIDMADNGAVVASKADKNYWIFSTITAPDPGEHPVSGHRMFSIRGVKDSDGYIFAIKGVDRPTNRRTSAAATFADTPFIVADWLWYGLVENLAKEIENNGGKVVRRGRYWARHNPSNVYSYVNRWLQNKEVY